MCVCVYIYIHIYIYIYITLKYKYNFFQNDFVPILKIFGFVGMSLVSIWYILKRF